MPRADLPDDLPANARQWHEQVSQRKLTGQTVHGRGLASASQMGYEQFLLLRVLWKITLPEKLGMERLLRFLDLRVTSNSLRPN